MVRWQYSLRLAYQCTHLWFFLLYPCLLKQVLCRNHSIDTSGNFIKLKLKLCSVFHNQLHSWYSNFENLMSGLSLLGGTSFSSPPCVVSRSRRGNFPTNKWYHNFQVFVLRTMLLLDKSRLDICKMYTENNDKCSIGFCRSARKISWLKPKGFFISRFSHTLSFLTKRIWPKS